jgi:hypothetical protein
MKSDGLSKLYDRLTVDELVRLRLAALARGDRADCDRLDRACSLGQYGAYCARLEASDVLTLCTMVELLPKLAKLQIVGAMRPLVAHLEAAGEDAAVMGYLDGHAAGWKAAGKRGEPPESSDAALAKAAARAYRVGTRFSEALDGLAAELACLARTPRDALAAFAEEEIGVGLEVLLGAWATPAIGTLAQHAEALDAADPDVEGLSLMGDVLRLAWRRHGLQDSTAEIDDELRERYEAAVDADRASGGPDASA